MRDPARQALRRDGAERVGQVVARVRRHLRRGAAALHGDADAVRAPVPADAAAARRRPRDGRAAVDRARAAHVARRRELDGRDGHRDRALPAPPLREGRRAALPEVRRGRRPDERRRALRAARARQARREGAAHGLRAGRARAQGHVPRPLHDRVARRRAGGARRRRHRRHRPAAEAREDEGAHDRSHRLLRPARGRSTARPSTARSRGAAARCASPRERPRPRPAPTRTSRCSRRRAPARAAAPASPSSTRGGSRSTPSRASARRARARASRAGRRPSSSTKGRTTRARRARARASRRPARRAPVRRDVRARRRRAPWRARSRASKSWRFVDRKRRRSRRRRTRSSCGAWRSCEQVGLGYLALDRPANSLSGRRDAATAPERAARQRPHRRALRARRADHRPAPARHGPPPREPARSSSTWARPSSSSSTTRRRSAPPITSSTSGPAAAATAATSSPRGPPRSVLADPRSPTGARAAKRRRASSARSARWPTRGSSSPARARNNLRDVDFRVPVGRMCVVAGVSGSGKSTLVRHVFYPALRRALGLVAARAGRAREPQGAQGRQARARRRPVADRPHAALGARRRSSASGTRCASSSPRCPRRRRAATRPARFSFNTPSAKTAPGWAAACPACEGQGIIVAEMPFLPDVVAPCEACGGSRFEPSTLEVRFAGLSIGDVLHLPADDAAQVFASSPEDRAPAARRSPTSASATCRSARARTRSRAARRSASSSPPSSRRARRTSRRSTCSTSRPRACTSPTCAASLGVLERLVARGDTLVIIEHHPDVIASADWVVELGPEAGEDGRRDRLRGRAAQALLGADRDRQGARVDERAGRGGRLDEGAPVEALASGAPVRGSRR